MKHTLYLVVVFIFLRGQVLRAGPFEEWRTKQRSEELNEVLGQKTRPTIAQTWEILKYIHDEPGIPLPLDDKNDRREVTRWLNNLVDHAPSVIAALEKTFPGATWAFVGRDVQLWADALEAFYLSIGQHSRVVRIGSSKSSFQAPEADQSKLDDTLIAVLESTGLFSLKGIEKGHPFILVDTISHGGGRQARAFLSAIHRKYKERGGNIGNILEKANIFGFLVSTFNGPSFPFTDAKQRLMEWKIAFNLEFIETIGQNQFLSLQNPQTHANEAGYEHFTGAWHGPFGPFEKQSDGKTYALPTKEYDLPERKNVLWIQREVIHRIKKPEFLKRVEGAAKELGYEFPLERPKPNDASSKNLTTEEIREQLNRILELNASAAEENPVSPQHQTQFSDHLRKTTGDLQTLFWRAGIKTTNRETSDTMLWIHQWVNQFINWPTHTHAIQTVLNRVLDLRAARRLRSNDFPVLFHVIFTGTKPTPEIVRLVHKIISSSNHARKAFEDEEWMRETPAYPAYKVVQWLIRDRESQDCKEAMEEK